MAEAEVGGDVDFATVDGDGEIVGVVGGSPELESHVVGAGLLVGRCSGDEAGEEDGGGSDELHFELLVCEVWV